MPKALKKTFTLLLILLAALVLAVLLYAAYAFLSFDRIEDNLPLDVSQNSTETLSGEGVLRLVSYNMGFGAYSDDYSFFMDGGKESRARSREAVHENIGGAVEAVAACDPDLILLQEMDFDSTRSHHVDEIQLVSSRFPEFSTVFAQNYDSPYLLWPLNAPHGANKAGTLTLSRYRIDSALRRSLPIEDGPMKIVDLDRCYSVNHIPMENGKELALYNFHLSAYTSDGRIAEEQLVMLFEDMQQDLEKGSYVIAGGDFNKDLLGDSSKVFGVTYGEANWAQPIPERLIPQGFRIEAPLDPDHPVPSCRNADRPYGPDDFVLTVDGFILSDNVSTNRCTVIDTGFRWSDHNPVLLEFTLK